MLQDSFTEINQRRLLVFYKILALNEQNVFIDGTVLMNFLFIKSNEFTNICKMNQKMNILPPILINYINLQKCHFYEKQKICRGNNSFQLHHIKKHLSQQQYFRIFQFYK